MLRYVSLGPVAHVYPSDQLSAWSIMDKSYNTGRVVIVKMSDHCNVEFCSVPIERCLHRGLFPARTVDQERFSNCMIHYHRCGALANIQEVNGHSTMDHRFVHCRVLHRGTECI